jgi:NAD(P) transhydrogenase
VEKLPNGKCEVTLENGRLAHLPTWCSTPPDASVRRIAQPCRCRPEADSRGRLKVNPETFQTDVPNIFAAGDVVGFPSLASTSMEQGRIAARVAVGAPPRIRRNTSPMASMPCRKSRPAA